MAMGYLNTFIAVAPDCPVGAGIVPDRPRSIAGLEYMLLAANPYRFTGKDLILAVHARHKSIDDTDIEPFKLALFSRSHPCLRASLLPNRYGWGAHYDASGRIALYGLGTDDYRRFTSQPGIKVIPAMRNRRL
ncbi:DUF6157 family protein [Rhodopila sp.]|jgi:hypothetical protein|uniref:DUF6157 family protein n=1 Tax=Rhodopila sp. TaxID=2480087 RepID=UPI002CBBD6E9|nr:DUF6157 family protein [Rhodopila sp.]HVZ07739.1 DUF6157 family protein [Rhodopila sp.]